MTLAVFLRAVALRLGPGVPKADRHRDDVNGDGLVDLVLHFETQRTGIDGNDSEACLSGETTDGQQLEGCDDIHVK